MATEAVGDGEAGIDAQYKQGPERLPFPPVPSSASLPPIKASLRLAALGLDGPRQRCEEFPEKREWQALRWHGESSVRLPLVALEALVMG
jgi:hypothetical protein